MQCARLVVRRRRDEVELRQFHILGYCDLARPVPPVYHVSRCIANCNNNNNNNKHPKLWHMLRQSSLYKKTTLLRVLFAMQPSRATGVTATCLSFGTWAGSMSGSVSGTPRSTSVRTTGRDMANCLKTSKLVRQKLCLLLHSLWAGQSRDWILVRRDFPHPFRPALGPTQPPVQWVKVKDKVRPRTGHEGPEGE